jgi:methionyl aminopeptidase
MIVLKSREEIDKIRSACIIVVEALKEMSRKVEDGITTHDLDKLAEQIALKHNAKPAFKGYRGYPSSVCFALNQEVVHGIPSNKTILKNGDIIGMDFGIFKDGYYGDSAITVPVGHVSEEAEKLLEVTKESLYKGISKAHAKNKLFDISRAIQEYVESNGYSVVRTFVGHGIGSKLHEDPQVPNFVPNNGNWGKGIVLKPGMVIAIEPMVNIGRPDVKILKDGWTAVTIDGSLSAHFEHTVAITQNGPEILTEYNFN